MVWYRMEQCKLGYPQRAAAGRGLRVRWPPVWVMWSGMWHCPGFGPRQQLWSKLLVPVLTALAGAIHSGRAAFLAPGVGGWDHTRRNFPGGCPLAPASDLKCIEFNETLRKSYTSPYVRHCRIVLAECGVDHEFCRSRLMPPVPGYRRRQECRFSTDGDRRLHDSASILKHIRSKTGQEFMADIDDF